MRALLGAAAYFCELVDLKAEYCGGRLGAVSMDPAEEAIESER